MTTNDAAELELVIEALSMAAGQLEKRTANGGAEKHAERALTMRRLRTRLCREREQRAALTQREAATA